MTRTRLRKILGVSALVLIPITFLVGSEVWYARSVRPDGIATTADFFARFGQPRHVRTVQRGGKMYSEYQGPLPGPFVLAVPSSPSAFIFDDHGNFVEFCFDPGDSPTWRDKWPEVLTQPASGTRP